MTPVTRRRRAPDERREDVLAAAAALFAARGVDVGRIRFSTAFGRGLDYYTGFVFELYDPSAPAAGQLVAGGRYDGLLTRLGSASAISAVGFAVWIERLVEQIEEAVDDLERELEQRRERQDGGSGGDGDGVRTSLEQVRLAAGAWLAR